MDRARNAAVTYGEEKGVGLTEPPGIDLYVLHREPDDVIALLASDVARVVQFLDDEPLDLGTGGASGGGTMPTGPGDRVLTFPIDGPRGAVEVALAGMFETDLVTLVAPSPADGAPADWWVLDLLARHDSAAVDLREIRWLDGDGLWWTNRAGPVRLPIVVDGPTSSTNAARVLRGTEAVQPGDLLSAWLEGATRSAAETTAESWEAFLCATYLSMAVAHIASGER